MYSKPMFAAFLLAIASTASAQTFRQAIESNPDLSLFSQLINTAKDVSDEFDNIIASPAGSQSKTVLVPNNQAVQQFLSNLDIDIKKINKNNVRPFLNYHVLLGNITSDQLYKPGGSIVRTQLKDDKYSLLPDDEGQVVYGKPKSDSETEMGKGSAVIESGLKQTVNVVQPDMVYENGIVHVVDGLLTLPKNCSETIQYTGAGRLVEYIKQVDLLDDLDSYPGATCFAPSDDAINAALPVLQNLTDQQLIDAIQFHTLLDPWYTTNLTDGQKIPTQLGPEITVNIRGNKFYFNGVRAKTVNDIAKNGVAYLLDGIMSPDFNGTIPDEPTATATTTTSTSVITSTATQTTGGPNSTATTGSSPTPTESPSSASALRVGASLLVAGAIALLTAF